MKYEARLEKLNSIFTCEFRHPLIEYADGSHRLVRTSLKTRVSSVANMRLKQLNTLLKNSKYWKLWKLDEFRHKFSEVVLEIFFRHIAPAETFSKESTLPVYIPDRAVSLKVRSNSYCVSFTHPLILNTSETRKTRGGKPVTARLDTQSREYAEALRNQLAELVNTRLYWDKLGFEMALDLYEPKVIEIFYKDVILDDNELLPSTQYSIRV